MNQIYEANIALETKLKSSLSNYDTAQKFLNKLRMEAMSHQNDNKELQMSVGDERKKAENLEKAVKLFEETSKLAASEKDKWTQTLREYEIRLKQQSE